LSKSSGFDSFVDSRPAFVRFTARFHRKNRIKPIEFMAKAKSDKYVYTWGNKKADGDGSMKPLLGGKGANLAEMTRIGLPVPPGFTITTEVCTYYYANKRTYPKVLQAQMEAGVANMEKIMGTKFGATSGMPLLVAVRSGARDSMPGMMDTILNLGLNDQSVIALADATKNPRFAWDCYRRFIQMYGDVVLGVQKREGEDHEPFETIIHEFKHEKYHKDIVDSELTAEDQAELVKRFKALVKDRTGKVFPNSPWDQLRGAAGAVFGSWMNDRASVYRRKYNIPTEWGTAVNVQAMVFGNTATIPVPRGVHAHPANGTNEFYGEFLINAQGEDVVAGVRTPEPCSSSRTKCPRATRNSWPCARPWKAISRTCRTSNSPSRAASCSCSRRATAAHRRRRAQVRRRHGEGKIDRCRDRRDAQSGRSARPVARADL